MVVVRMAMEEEEKELNRWLTWKRYATDMFHGTASVDGDLLYKDDNIIIRLRRMVRN
jgi:hypothetical protein